MQTSARVKLGLGGLAAALALFIGVSSADARRIELSNQGFRSIWTLIAMVVEGVASVSCPVTLEGSFHSRTLSKVSNQLFGYITRAFVRGDRAACLNTGTATILTETLPWHLTYESFTGTLPTISGVSLLMVNMAMRVHPEGQIECLGNTETGHPGKITMETSPGNVIRTGKMDETKKIPLGGSFLCELSGSEVLLRGSAEVFVLGSTTTRITMRLVA